jgi:F0F1-type ATP synthase membrane subunit b/b'
MIDIHPGELLAAALIFLFTLLCLNRLLFQPVMRCIKEREHLTTGRIHEADDLLQRYGQLTQEYEATLRAEKSASYRRLEERRNAGLKQRAAMIAGARQDADEKLAAARAEMSGQLERVKGSLAGEARDLAAMIGRRLLGRNIQ